MNNQELTTTESKTMNPRNERVFIPSADIYADPNKITINLEMPGVKEKDLDIHVEANELRISGTRSDQVPDTKRLFNERPRGLFRRIFTLDERVDRDSIQAKIHNGVLKLELGIREAAKPRRIPIQVSA